MFKLEKFDGKSMNVPNHENLMENCVHQTYRQSGLVEKFDFVKNTKSWKFNGKLCTLDVQIVWNCKKNWIH